MGLTGFLAPSERTSIFIPVSSEDLKGLGELRSDSLLVFPPLPGDDIICARPRRVQHYPQPGVEACAVAYVTSSPDEKRCYHEQGWRTLRTPAIPPLSNGSALNFLASNPSTREYARQFIEDTYREQCWVDTDWPAAPFIYLNTTKL